MSDPTTPRADTVLFSIPWLHHRHVTNEAGGEALKATTASQHTHRSGEPAVTRPVHQLSLWLILLTMAGFVPAAETAGAEAGPPVLHVAFVVSAFRGTTNKADAVAAVSVWAEQVAQSRNISVKTVVTAHADADALGRAVLAGKADLIVVSALEFLYIRTAVPIDPLYMGTRQGSPFTRFLLLVRRDATIADLHDLAGQEVLLQSRGPMTGPREWLDTIIHKNGLPQDSVRVKVVVKATDTILPVFFGKHVACVATEESYRTMVELNPQVGRTLRVLRKSPPLALLIACIRRDYREFRREAIEEMGALKETPRGQQVLALFRYSQVIPFDEAKLASASALLKAYLAVGRATQAAEPTEQKHE